MAGRGIWEAEQHEDLCLPLTGISWSSIPTSRLGMCKYCCRYFLILCACRCCAHHASVVRGSDIGTDDVDGQHNLLLAANGANWWYASAPDYEDRN